MSEDLEPIDMEYTLDENVIGDVPPLHERELYAQYDAKRAEFVDAATYAHEVELHQAAMRRIAELERERDAARQRAEQVEAELVKAQSRLIAGAVYEKLDSINYWKTRAEQAEILHRGTGRTSSVEEINAFHELKRVKAERDAANGRAQRYLEMKQEFEKAYAQAEADARVLAKIARDARYLYGEPIPEEDERLIAKYLDGAK